MRAPETISTTKLARKFAMSNRDLESRLRALGIEPVNTVTIAGRRYCAWDKRVATEKLTERAQGFVGSTAQPADIRDDLQEIKNTVAEILKVVKPHEEAPDA